MARGVNKVILVGNLGADPESRSTASGTQVVNIRLATTDNWKDRQTGDPQERTEWHRVVLFGRLGEVAAQYLRKGSQCYIEGRIQTRKWQGQDGQDRYTTEIVANDMQLLGGRGGGGGGGRSEGSPRGEEAPAWDQDPATEPSRRPSGGQGSSRRTGQAPDDFDDDIPF